MLRPSYPWPLAAITLALLATAGQTGCETKCATTRDGYTCSELAFPTGERSTSQILVCQSSPREVRAGQETDYFIDVTNLTGASLQNVAVNMDNMSNAHIVSSWPEAVRASNGSAQWIIADLPARSTKTITVRARPTSAGTATGCITAGYANALCTVTPVVAPALNLLKSATPEVCGQCDDIQLTYVVRNPGTGKADNVTVTDTLPAGMTTVDGGRTVEFRVGDLDSGAERTFTVNAKANKPGTFVSSASAQTASGISVRSADVSTVVKQPSLAFSCDANNHALLGRDLPYRITVRNTGACDAADASIVAQVPSGTAFVSADGGGRFDGANVTWSMPSLPAGKSTTVTMNLHPASVGVAKVKAIASARCVPATSTECQTEVTGIPAILLEVVDTVDPVAVGTEATFNVVVTNQGSTSDSNVRVTGTLPESMQFVAGSGATGVSAVGQTVTIAPLTTLAPGARAEWRIRVKAKSVADARSRWEMTSDQFKAPIIETESTNLYE